MCPISIRVLIRLMFPFDLGHDQLKDIIPPLPVNSIATVVYHFLLAVLRPFVLLHNRSVGILRSTCSVHLITR